MSGVDISCTAPTHMVIGSFQFFSAKAKHALFPGNKKAIRSNDFLCAFRFMVIGENSHANRCAISDSDPARIFRRQFDACRSTDPTVCEADFVRFLTVSNDDCGCVLAMQTAIQEFQASFRDHACDTFFSTTHERAIGGTKHATGFKINDQQSFIRFFICCQFEPFKNQLASNIK